MHEVDPLDQFPSLQHREDAMGAYLMMFATLAMGLPLPILNLIASVIYAVINGSKSDFVRFHVLQSLYSQIAVSGLNAYAIFTVVSALFFGGTDGGFDPAWIGWLLTLGGLNLTYIVFSIVAAVQARKGQLFKFPFFGWLAMLNSYGRRAHS